VADLTTTKVQVALDTAKYAVFRHDNASDWWVFEYFIGHSR
jgi:hypothetical protein